MSRWRPSRGGRGPAAEEGVEEGLSVLGKGGVLGGGGSMASGEEDRGWGGRGGSSSIWSGNWERRTREKLKSPLIGQSVPTTSVPLTYLLYKKETLTPGHNRSGSKLLKQRPQQSSTYPHPNVRFLLGPPLSPQTRQKGSTLPLAYSHKIHLIPRLIYPLYIVLASYLTARALLAS